MGYENSWNEGVYWTNWEFKDLIGRFGEVEGFKYNLPKSVKISSFIL